MKKTLQKIASTAGLLGLLALAGCGPETEYKIEYSPVLHEDAKVVEKVYTPLEHRSDVGPKVSMGFDGNLNFGLGMTEVDVAPKYAVVLAGQHNKFVAENKDLWTKLNTNEVVDVNYREVYRVISQGTNILKRDLINYEILNAMPKTNNIELEAK